MKNLFRTAVAAIYLLGATMTSAHAEGDARDFTLHNHIGGSITHLYVSEVSNNHWETDVLGKDVLADGDETKVTFSGYAEDVCAFDIKITEEGVQDWIVSNVDLCKTNDISFSKENGAVVYTQT